MTTEVTIKLLSNDYRLRQQVQDEINSRYIIFEPVVSGKSMIFSIDDVVSREGIIQALSEDVLEYIDTIEVGKKQELHKEMENSPFHTAYSMMK